MTRLQGGGRRAARGPIGTLTHYLPYLSLIALFVTLSDEAVPSAVAARCDTV